MWGRREQWRVRSSIVEHYIMKRAKLLLFSMALVFPIIVRYLCVAQNNASEVAQPSQPRISFHGLTLELTQGSPEPAESPELKICRATHPPLACVPLTITLGNDGPDRLLIWGSSCGDMEPQIDIQQADGSWAPFPQCQSPACLRICNRNVLSVHALARGESRVRHWRLSDSSLDVTYAPPDDGFIHPPCRGCEWLNAPGPHLIRARLSVSACPAAKKLKPDDPLAPFDPQSICEAGEKRDGADELRVRGQGLVQELDGHLAADDRVLAEVDGAHAPAPEQAHDAEAPDHGPDERVGRERQLGERGGGGCSERRGRGCRARCRRCPRPPPVARTRPGACGATRPTRCPAWG